MSREEKGDGHLPQWHQEEEEEAGRPAEGGSEGRGRANRSVCGVKSGGFTTHNDTLSRDGKELSTTLGFGST